MTLHGYTVGKKSRHCVSPNTGHPTFYTYAEARAYADSLLNPVGYDVYRILGTQTGPRQLELVDPETHHPEYEP